MSPVSKLRSVSLALIATSAAYAFHPGGAEATRVLEFEEMASVRGGASIDIVVPHMSTGNTTTVDNPIIGYNMESLTTSDLYVLTYVNGTKTGAVLADHSADGEYNELRARMKWPLPSTANIELKYCDGDGNLPCPSTPASDNKVSYTWSKKMKLAGVNFWHVTAGGATATMSMADQQSSVDATDVGSDFRMFSADAILTAENMSVADEFGMGINCSYNSIWQFAYRKTAKLSIGNDVRCLNPTIPDLDTGAYGPTPVCTDFATRVTNALAAAEPAYGDYVNVVIIDEFHSYDSVTKQYDQNAPVGIHFRGKKWIGLPKHVTSFELGQRIVHEWGHQAGLPHETVGCGGGAFNRPIMCELPGFGISKKFCDTISTYTGTKNFNPNR